MSVFKMELGTIVTFKIADVSGSVPVLPSAGAKSPVYQIVKMDGPGQQVKSIHIIGMAPDSKPETKPVGEIVDFYKPTDVVEDVIVRADAIPRIETYEEILTDA